jgi:hypothetical protein
MSHPVPEPSVDESVLNENGWAHDGTEKDSVTVEIFGPLDLEAYMYTKVFRDAELQSELRDRTLGKLDRKINVFFANRTHIEPEIDNLPLGVGRKQVLWGVKMFARKKFEDRLRQNGVRVTESSKNESVEVDVGARADVELLDCAYEIDGVEVSVTDEERITLGSSIDIVNLAGCVSVWHHEKDIFVAGGVYPTQDIEITQTADLTESIDLKIDIDLDIWPKPYKQEMFELISSVG